MARDELSRFRTATLHFKKKGVFFASSSSSVPLLAEVLIIETVTNHFNLLILPQDSTQSDYGVRADACYHELVSNDWIAAMNTNEVSVSWGPPNQRPYSLDAPRAFFNMRRDAQYFLCAIRDPKGTLIERSKLAAASSSPAPLIAVGALQASVCPSIVPALSILT
ncbi:hypothetical protein EIP91_004912 [Steccherinum ochraceum]|uniref:Uncharacterized protein n=1 Tax=Steccherinum ochraceum TaxID=92696 RepID=A0A4V2MVU2_9APHY|nr:hypothetical protein EIP91_004912 [Steccherinum ochraceum]